MQSRKELKIGIIILLLTILITSSILIKPKTTTIKVYDIGIPPNKVEELKKELP